MIKREIETIRPETKWAKHFHKSIGGTCDCGNSLGWEMLSVDITIEFGDSWFTTKTMPVDLF